MQLFLTFLLLLFSFISNAFSQVLPIHFIKGKGEQINFTTLLDELGKNRTNITNKDLEKLEIRDFNVKFNELDRNGMDYRFKNGGDSLKIKYDITLSHIEFDDSFWFVVRNLHFQNFFKITSCKNVKIIFKDCSFEKGFKFDNNEAHFLKFENCQFKNGFMYHLNKLSEYISFDYCFFGINPLIEEDNRTSAFNKFDIEYHLFHFLNKTEPFDLIITNSIFKIPSNLAKITKYHVNILDSNFKNLRFENTQINTTLNLSATTVENQFQLEDCIIKDKIVIDALNINPQNARLEWSIIANEKISVFDKEKKIFNGTTLIDKEKIYNRIVGCYSTFYQVFKSQGNRFYANGCYIEWKNIETKYLKNSYQKTGNTQVYFIYLMNIFLRDFCAYGTDPLKSIYLSIYVVLCFAFFYFLASFFYIKEKSDNPDVLKRYIDIFKIYLLNNVTLSDTFRNTENTLFQNKQIRNKKLPIFFILFNYDFKELLFVSYIKQKMYALIDIFPDRWVDLSRSKKIKASIIFGVILFVIFLYVLVIKVLDCISLSLNVFSTLGFGDMPISGIVRYLAILEGFIGWFLLSIFSVCLISQVIQ